MWKWIWGHEDMKWHTMTIGNGNQMFIKNSWTQNSTDSINIIIHTCMEYGVWNIKLILLMRFPFTFLHTHVPCSIVLHSIFYRQAPGQWTKSIQTIKQMDCSSWRRKYRKVKGGGLWTRKTKGKPCTCVCLMFTQYAWNFKYWVLSIEYGTWNI